MPSPLVHHIFKASYPIATIKRKGTSYYYYSVSLARQGHSEMPSLDSKEK